MNFKQYLIIMLFSALVSWFTWFFVIFNIDPFETSILGFVFFYFSLFLALCSSLSLVILTLYHFLASDELPLFRYVSISVKQSLLITFFILLFIFLQMKALLTWFNASILFIIFILIISFTISIKKKENIAIES